MKKRILASVLVLVMLICLLPVTAIADGNQGWTVDDDARTVKIYTAEGLRAWAKSITEGPVTNLDDECTRYDDFTVSIEDNIDLSGADVDFHHWAWWKDHDRRKRSHHFKYAD